MKSFSALCFLLLAFPCFLQSQEVQAYIIGMEKEKIYLDRNAAQVKPGDRYRVYIREGHFIHPVTKKKIEKEKEWVGTLEILQSGDEYSIAGVHPPAALEKLTTGMSVILQPHTLSADTGPAGTTETGKEKMSETIAPAKVNDIVGVGYFGEYVADMLMEEIITSPHIRIIDRSILGYQMDEADLTGDYISGHAPAIRGNISGVQYRIEVTMQKPDVTNVSTGIPLAYAMGAIQSISGTNLGAQYMSNVQVSRLRAAVHISARVVDMQSGEVMFICSGEGTATGQAQVGLEQGALSGARINDGVEGFKQTVTGKATQLAFRRIGRYLKNYFAGDMEEKIAKRGGLGFEHQQLVVKGHKLYLGTEKIDKHSAQMFFEDSPAFYFNYNKSKKLNRIGNGLLLAALPVTAIGGYLTGVQDDPEEYLIITGMAVGSLLVAGAGLKIYSRIQLQNTTRAYNGKNKADSYSGLYLGPSSTMPGIGLSYRF